MPTTYRRTNTTSDLGGGADFNKAILLPASDATGPQTISLGNNETRTSRGFTASGVPGASGTSTGTFTVEMNVATGNTNVGLSVTLHRINSAGTVQASSATSAEQNATAGVHTFTFSSPALGTWASGDRLRVDYTYRNLAHGGQTFDAAHGGENNEVIAPWTTATTNTRTHTTDLVLRATETPTHTTDLVLDAGAATETTTHSTDLVVGPTPTTVAWADMEMTVGDRKLGPYWTGTEWLMVGVTRSPDTISVWSSSGATSGVSTGAGWTHRAGIIRDYWVPLDDVGAVFRDSKLWIVEGESGNNGRLWMFDPSDDSIYPGRALGQLGPLDTAITTHLLTYAETGDGTDDYIRVAATENFGGDDVAWGSAYSVADDGFSQNFFSQISASGVDVLAAGGNAWKTATERYFLQVWYRADQTQRFYTEASEGGSQGTSAYVDFGYSLSHPGFVAYPNTYYEWTAAVTYLHPYVYADANTGEVKAFIPFGNQESSGAAPLVSQIAASGAYGRSVDIWVDSGTGYFHVVWRTTANAIMYASIQATDEEEILVGTPRQVATGGTAHPGSLSFVARNGVGHLLYSQNAGDPPTYIAFATDPLTPEETYRTHTTDLVLDAGAATETRTHTTDLVLLATATATHATDLIALPVGVYATDNFNRSDRAELDEDISSGGGAWSQIAGLIGIVSNQARPAAANNQRSVYVLDPQPPSADYEVKADITITEDGTGRGVAGVLARNGLTVQTGYYAEINHSNDELNLFYVDAGTNNSIGTVAAFGWVNNQTYELILRVDGTTISVLVDGTQEISVNDSSHSLVGRGGIRTFDFGTAEAGVDDFEVRMLPEVASKLHTTDLVLRATETRTHTTDLVLQATETPTHTTDLALQATEARTHATDLILQTTVEVTHTTDLILQAIEQVTHSTDLITEVGLTTETVTHTTDLIVQATVEAAHTTDLVLKVTETLAHTTDLATSAAGSIPHSTDLVVGNTWEDVSGLLAADTIQYLDEGLTPDTCYEYRVVAIADGTDYPSDAAQVLLPDLVAAAHTTDLILEVGVATESALHTTDLAIADRVTAAHSTDLILLVTEQVAHTTDLVLPDTFTVTHATDLFVRDTLTQNHTTDLVLQATEQATHASDLVLQATETRTQTSDLLVSAGGMVTQSTDLILQATDTAAHTTDLVVLGAPGTPDVVATAQSMSSIEITWTDVADETSYRVERRPCT